MGVQKKKKKSDMLSEVTLHLFMVSRGIGINLNLLEINLVNTLILDVGLFYVLGDVLGGLLNDRLKALLSELFQRKERYLVSFYKLVRAGKVVSFSCVESWRIVYGESVIRMAIKAKILATSQLLKEFQPHVKTVSPGLKRFMNSVPVWAYDSATVMKKSYPAGDGLIDDESEVLGFGPLSPYTFGSLFINLGHGGHRTALSLPYIKFDAKVLPGFGPLYVNKYPQTQDECRYVLRKLACRQVKACLRTEWQLCQTIRSNYSQKSIATTSQKSTTGALLLDITRQPVKLLDSRKDYPAISIAW